MPKNEVGSAARLAAAAGLGLTLALGAVPVVAMAENATATMGDVTEESSSPVDATEEESSPVYIGEVGYESLQAAVNDSEDGAVIEVMDNLTDQHGFTLRSNSISIDLNGHRVEFTSGRAIAVNSGASLDITDSSESGTGALVGSDATSFINCSGKLTVTGGVISNTSGAGNQYGSVYLHGSSASLTMTGGSIESNLKAVTATSGAHAYISGGRIESLEQSSTALELTGAHAEISGDAALSGAFGVVLFNSNDNNEGSDPSTLTMTGGTIKTKYFGISGNNTRSAGTEVDISGGTIDTDDASIYWPMEGELSISGDSTSISGSTALEAKMGTITITGGSFSADGEFGSIYSGDGSYDDGSALKFVGQLYGTSEGQYITDPDLEVTISGATVTSENGNAISVYNAAEDGSGEDSIPSSKIEVSADVSMTPASGKDPVRVTSFDEFSVSRDSVTSGNATVINAALADAAAQAQNKVTEGSSTDQSQSADKTMYTLYSTLGAALENASTADGGRAEVTLLRDVTEDVSVPEGSDVSLDLNDYTLTGGIENSGTLELAGSGEIIGQITGNVATTGEGSSVTTYVATVGDQTFSDLQAALTAASSADDKTVLLHGDVSCGQLTIPEGVTLDGNGFTITCNENYSTGAFITVGEGADGVTIKNVVVSVPVAEDENKHAIQFYKNEGGTLDGVTINGGNWTSVIVNGATNVTVKDSVLNPNEGAYANIEYAMGGGVTTVPSLTVDGVKFKDGVTQVWADDATVSAICGVLPGVQTNDDVVEKIAGSVTNRNDGPIQIAVRLDGGNDSIVTETVQSVTNPPSNPGGSVSSGEQVKVSETDGGKVTVTPTRADEGDEVTITATPDEGQEVRSVSVTDADGKAVQVKAGEKDGEYVFTMPDGAVTVTVEFGCDGGELCPTHGFNDVDQSAWYHDAVDWAVENGVLNGYGEGGESLGPVADVTRAEMAQMLWNRAGRPEAAADLSAFTDVDAGGWYAPALEWCVSEGIFSGYGDTFGTERTISREEAVTVLWRLSGSPEADADLSGYGDASSVSDYATGAIEWAVSTGVLTGKGGVALDPQAGCTRGEVAAMMMRMAQ